MPKKYKDCVRKVENKGKSESSAHAICTSVDADGIKEVRHSEKRQNRYKKLHGDK